MSWFLSRLTGACAIALILSACGTNTPAQPTGSSSTGSSTTGAATGTTDTPTSAATATTTTTTTTEDPTTSSSGDTGEAFPCGLFERLCNPEDSICLEIDEGDNIFFQCVPNPDDCIPDGPCSPACLALCETYVKGICLEQDPSTPHILRCPEFIACNTSDVDPGCPEGQKCNPRHHCAPLAPDPIPVGDPCNTLTPDPCVANAFCAFGSETEPSGTCRPFCTGSVDDPVCPADSACADLGDFSVCLPTCDPLAPDCPDLYGCYPSPNKDGLFLCALGPSLPDGALYSPCEFANACAPGLFCSADKNINPCDPNASGCCLPYCDLNMPICPDMGLECTPWHAMGTAPPGLEAVGHCAPPP
jgi:hypothetical protein